MACEFTVKTIEPTECIGNSLEKINTNFRDLKVYACQNYDRLETIDSRIVTLDTQITNLSAITVPGVTKAWLKFDGTRDTSGVVSSNSTNRFIYSAYNIDKVQVVRAGDYRIYFKLSFPTPNYIAVGTSSQTSGEVRTWLQPYDYRTNFLGVKIANVNNFLVAAKHISIAIY